MPSLTLECSRQLPWELPSEFWGHRPDLEICAYGGGGAHPGTEGRTIVPEGKVCRSLMSPLAYPAASPDSWESFLLRLGTLSPSFNDSLSPLTPFSPSSLPQGQPDSLVLSAQSCCYRVPSTGQRGLLRLILQLRGALGKSRPVSFAHPDLEPALNPRSPAGTHREEHGWLSGVGTI